MGARPRPNLPGATFHVVTRVQNRAHLLAPPPLRSAVVQLLRAKLRRSDATLLAYCIMTNHLHLVLIQGEQPLWRLMQPLLRSVAMLAQDFHDVEGHVFERRYRHVVCLSQLQLQRTIAYVHSNPVRAGLCADAADYPWSSHRAYLRLRNMPGQAPVAVRLGLAAFGWRDGAGANVVRSAYDGLVRATTSSVGDEADLITENESVATVSVTGTDGANERSDADARLHTIVATVLARAAPGMSIDRLRMPWVARRHVPVRREIVHAAAREGFKGRRIAEFLAASPQTVSRLLADEPGGSQGAGATH